MKRILLFIVLLSALFVQTDCAVASDVQQQKEEQFRNDTKSRCDALATLLLNLRHAYRAEEPTLLQASCVYGAKYQRLWNRSSSMEETLRMVAEVALPAYQLRSSLSSRSVVSRRYYIIALRRIRC